MLIYEQLWNEAVSAFAHRRPQLDLNLPDKTRDRRRGVSLVLRPSPSAQAKIKVFMDGLAGVFPGQYCYQPAELHVTVLSIISATDLWREEIGELAVFRGILGEILSRQHSFKLDFRGVTAAPNAVLIQGFPVDDELAKIRDRLRSAFAQRGYAHRLDRRYPNQGAHMTAMRFCRPATNWMPLAAKLGESRQLNFGATQVDSLQLIWGDWYASAKTVRTLAEYRLSSPAHPADVP